MTWRHPHAYDWHDGHTGHHLDDNRLLVKADPQPHPHMDAPPKNDQAAGVGVSTYAKFAHPYGSITPGAKTDLLHYDYRGKLPQIEDLVKKHGYNVYYAGGKYGKPDLANRNYNTNHLMVYDPTPGSGGDSGEEEYTKGWRQIHELAHALTYPQLNKIYGEGRRIGKLGTHRSLNDAMRAVHWEHLAAHKQRELSKQIGIHIPDHVFNKEYNTVMHDALHRAVTGKFTEPSQEGFEPHGHQLPLTHALDTLRDEASTMGLKGPHDVLARKSEPKSEQVISMTYRSEQVADETFNNEDVIELAKSYLAKRTVELAKNLKDWQERELKKAVIPPHKHNLGTTASGGIEDVPPGQINPPGKLDAIKAESDADRSDKPQTHANHTCTNCGKQNTTVTEAPQGKNPAAWHCSSCLGKSEETPGESSSEESSSPSEESIVEALCEKCGKTHALDKCSLTKEMLVDTKGKTVDTGINPDSTLPEDTKSKKIEAKGSGGTIKKSLAEIRNLAKAQPLSKPPVSEAQRKAMAAAAHGDSTLDIPKKVGKEFIDADKGGKLPDTKKAMTPPTAKPPSGKTMATNVPMSKDVKEMVVHNSTPVKPPKDADFKAKKDGPNAVYTTKAGMDPQMKQHMQHAAGGPTAAPAAAPIASPTQDAHAARAAEFAQHMPGAGVTGHAMGAPAPKRPGIFGRLNKSENLAKAGTATLTQGMPKLKPAGMAMAPATGVGGHATMPTGSMGPTAIKPAVKTPNLPGYRTPKLPNQPAVLTQGMPKLKPAGMAMAPATGVKAPPMGAAAPGLGEKTVGAKPANVNAPTKTSAPNTVVPPAGDKTQPGVLPKK